MKNALASIFALLHFASPAFSINRYQIGDTLWVWATSGLVLREQAEFSGKRLDLVPFGTAVVCLGAKSWESIETIEAAPAFEYGSSHEKSSALKLRGQFLKITFNGKEGFVFDAYLSRLSTPKNVGWVEYSDKSKRLEIRSSDWQKESFGVASFSERKYPQPTDSYEVTTVYKNGIVLHSEGDMKGGVGAMIFPDFSLEEAYLYLNLTWHIEDNLKRTADPKSNRLDIPYYFIKSEKGFEFGMGMCGATIKYLDDARIAILTTSCSE